jgi:sulfite reductase beta subunit-like hemoprotein
MGWLTGDQMIGIADLVEPFGGAIRMTRQQDLIVGNVPDGQLAALLTGMEALGLPITRNRVYGNSIACTSHKFCNYSVAETKGKLRRSSRSSSSGSVTRSRTSSCTSTDAHTRAHTTGSATSGCRAPRPRIR